MDVTEVVEGVKILQGIAPDDSSKDALILKLLTKFYGDLMTATNRTEVQMVEVQPAVFSLLEDMVEHRFSTVRSTESQGIKSEKIGDYTVEYFADGVAGVLPDSLRKRINKITLMRFV